MLLLLVGLPLTAKGNDNLLAPVGGGNQFAGFQAQILGGCFRVQAPIEDSQKSVTSGRARLNGKVMPSRSKSGFDLGEAVMPHFWISPQ